MSSSALEIVFGASGLSEIEPGLWSSATGRRVSYPAHGHTACFQVEDESFWFAHRSKCVVSVVRRSPPPGPIVDVGSGNGYVTRSLRAAGFEVIALEPGESGARNAHRRGLVPVVWSTFEDAGFASSSLPAVALFDVLEHIDHDVEYLEALADHLVRGGLLYLTVPAHPLLWSDADVEAGHFRRYSRSRLTDAVRSAGLEVEYVSAYFGPLVLPILCMRALPFRLGWRRPTSEDDAQDRYASELRGPRGLAGSVLARRLSVEASRVERGAKRWGASLILVARRAPEARSD